MENKFPRRSNWKYEKSDSFGPFGKSFMDSLFHVSRPIDLVPIRANPSKDSQNYRLIGHKSIYMPIHRWSIIDPSGDICRRTDTHLIYDDFRFLSSVQRSRNRWIHGPRTVKLYGQLFVINQASSICRLVTNESNPRVDCPIDEYFFFFKRLMRSFMDVESLLD